jgi:hypothetical protein
METRVSDEDGKNWWKLELMMKVMKAVLISVGIVIASDNLKKQLEMYNYRLHFVTSKTQHYFFCVEQQKTLKT